MIAKSQIRNGRTVIPATIRQQMDLKDGDQLIWQLDDGVLSATTRHAQLNNAQSRFQKLLPPNSQSLADEVIAQRRAEAEQE